MPTLPTSTTANLFYLLLLFLSGCRPHAAQLADPRSADEKEWDAAHDAENATQLNEARTAYFSLCEKDPPYVRACFDHARLLYLIEPVDSARAASVKTILRYPDTAFTQSLVKRLARSYRASNSAAQGLTVLAALDKQLKGSEVRDTILFEMARLAREQGDIDGETDSLATLVRTYGRWKSQLWDDAVWRLSEIGRETQRTDVEIAWLNKLSAAHESSRLIGSYTSPYYDDALFRLGEIHLNAGRLDAAGAAFSALSALSTSRMCDDGVLGLARVDLAAGRVREACEKLTKLQKKDGSTKQTAVNLSVSNRCENR